MTVCCTALCALSRPRLMLKTGLYTKLKALFRGIYFLVFMFKKKFTSTTTTTRKKVVKETPTFDRTKNSEHCVQKDRVR